MVFVLQTKRADRMSYTVNWTGLAENGEVIDGQAHTLSIDEVTDDDVLFSAVVTCVGEAALGYTELVDARGGCPRKHRVAFDAARAAKALRDG